MSQETVLGVRRKLTQALIVALIAATGGPGAQGSPAGVAFVIDNCNDSGTGSLRAAMLAAGSGAVVDLSQLTCSTITLTTGALTDPNADSLQIEATPRLVAGRPMPSVTIDAGGNSRVIDHRGSGELDLTGVQLRHGHSIDTGGGGCLYSKGHVWTMAVIVSDCVATATGSNDALGGGIASNGLIELHSSTISGNSAHGDGSGYAYGGGIFSRGGLLAVYSTIADNFTTGFGYGGGVGASGPINVQSTLVAGNTAAYGGGLDMFGGSIGAGDLQIINSTIAGNHATGFAAGVEANGELTVTSSTIAGNAGDKPQRAAGIVLGGSHVLHVVSSIVANNTQNDVAHDIAGATSMDGHANLINASTVTLPIGTLSGDPMLNRLADNGGQTQTMSLQSGSPAIDAGDQQAGVLCDQRGGALNAGGGFSVRFPRANGTEADIGAFESGVSDSIFRSGFEIPFILLCHSF